MQHESQVNGAAPAPRDPRLAGLERQLTEAFDELWDSFVDRDDALYDVDGTRWLCVDGGPMLAAKCGIAFNQQELAEIRGQCRALAVSNPFAINGHDYHLS